jgi:hypothetical protein
VHVLRVLRVLLPIAVVLAVVAAAAAVLSARPDLDQAKRRVDRRWEPVAEKLGPHYVRLAAAGDKLRALTGPVRELGEEIDVALRRWQDATAAGDVEHEVRAANELEALGRRVVAAAATSTRVRENAEARAAVQAYATDPAYSAATIAADVAAFNDAVIRYERERHGPVRGPVASLLGREDIPTFASVPSV